MYKYIGTSIATTVIICTWRSFPTSSLENRSSAHSYSGWSLTTRKKAITAHKPIARLIYPKVSMLWLLTEATVPPPTYKKERDAALSSVDQHLQRWKRWVLKTCEADVQVCMRSVKCYQRNVGCFSMIQSASIVTSMSFAKNGYCSGRIIWIYSECTQNVVVSLHRYLTLHVELFFGASVILTSK